MSVPKILVIPGGLRMASASVKLAALATKELILADADVTRISLMDYSLPIYDGDCADRNAPPANAVRLKQLLSTHHGVFIAAPEINASVAPLMKNAIDWISVVREGCEPPYAAYRNRVFALAVISEGPSGAMQSLSALRQVLASGCGATVLAEQVGVANAGQAFDHLDQLTDPRAASELKLMLRKLIDAAKLMTRR
jgi:NAD(P)H-dependent FMN reductase